jgi:hypothetical protein
MTKDFLPPEKRMCHLTGFTKKCRSLVTSGKCGRWMYLNGLDRNTGEQMIMSAHCVDDVLPGLLIENTQMARETGAAVESLRNEVDKAHKQQMVMQSRELIDHLNGRPIKMIGESRNDD